MMPNRPNNYSLPFFSHGEALPSEVTSVGIWKKLLLPSLALIKKAEADGADHFKANTDTYL